MGVLTKAELKALRAVETAEVEAQEIQTKFERVLDMLKAGQSGNVNIACPHCVWNSNTGFLCHLCRYNSKAAMAARPERIRELRFMSCITYTFGGVTAVSVADSLKLSAYAITVLRGASINPRSNQLRKVVRFCKGHIEWAKAVIRERRMQDAVANSE